MRPRRSDASDMHTQMTGLYWNYETRSTCIHFAQSSAKWQQPKKADNTDSPPSRLPGTSLQVLRQQALAVVEQRKEHWHPEYRARENLKRSSTTSSTALPPDMDV